MEVEADGYAAHSMLQNLFGGGIGTNLHLKLKSSKVVDDFTLTYFLLAIGSLFYLWGNRTFSSSDVRGYEHPPALMRLNVFMRDIEGWLNDNHPVLVNWGTIQQFQDIMNAIAQAAEGTVNQAAWDEQGRYLLSPEGRRYIDELYEARRLLRAEMEPFQWHLSSSH
jgi:hypothetical protein